LGLAIDRPVSGSSPPFAPTAVGTYYDDARKSFVHFV